MIGRLAWIALGRFAERARTRGFYASLRSFSSASRYAGYNSLHGNTAVINSTVGRFTYFGGGVVKDADIGAFCSFGPDVQVGGMGRHPVEWITTHPSFYSPTGGQTARTFARSERFPERARTLIGNDVWVGARALVLDGVEIGDGVIVAAGSVVTKSAAPYSIIGGVPARLIRMRFDETAVRQLLQLRWWEWPLETLETISETMCTADIDALAAHAFQQ